MLLTTQSTVAGGGLRLKVTLGDDCFVPIMIGAAAGFQFGQLRKFRERIQRT